MLFETKKIIDDKGDGWQVISEENVFATFSSEEEADQLKTSLESHVNEGNDVADFKIEDIKKKMPDDPNPPPPGGMVKGIKSGFDFRPDLYQAPMGKKKEHKRRILDFQQFLKTINYKTHDGRTQDGHGQNLQP